MRRVADKNSTQKIKKERHDFCFLFFVYSPTSNLDDFTTKGATLNQTTSCQVELRELPNKVIPTMTCQPKTSLFIHIETNGQWLINLRNGPGGLIFAGKTPVEFPPQKPLEFKFYQSTHPISAATDLKTDPTHTQTFP